MSRRIYRTIRLTSRSNSAIIHRVVIFYGGTMDRPSVECDCPKAQFGNAWCWHKDRAWNDVTGFQQASRFALEKRFGFGILQTLDRRASLYFDYTIPLLEKLTAVAKLGVKEYFILYEQLRPKEPRELQKKAA